MVDNTSRRLVYLTCLSVSWLVTASQEYEDAAYWRNIAAEDMLKQLKNTPNTNIAKNIILFIGDGMGLSTVMAARTMKGQLNGKPGEETVLEFEKFPHTGLAKVYTTNRQVPDSAATATAFLSGVKTKSRVIGLDNTVSVGVCQNITTAKVTSILDWCQKANKSAGVVTTTRVTHATPAAAYAHTPHRDWERAFDVPESQEKCSDIASQLIMENDIQVVLGGGRKQFQTFSARDPTTGQYYQNLLQAWKDDKTKRNKSHEIVANSGQLNDVNTNETEYLMGLFSDSHMDYEIERDKSRVGEPSLAEMTRKAIQVLQNNKQGFFLLIEGGRIDHAHHANQAKKALYETLAFEEAVKVAMETTSQQDTLIIVTADHSHVMTISGYPDRGNGILDLVHENGALSHGSDGLPYTTLSYANGNSYTYFRQDLTDTDTTADNYKQSAAVPMDYETHSGEDIPIYSRGPMAHLLTGVKEQNVIAYVMAHAACVGDIGIPCSQGREAMMNLVRQNSQRDLHAARTDNSTQNPSNDVPQFTNDKIFLISLIFLSSLQL